MSPRPLDVEGPPGARLRAFSEQLLSYAGEGKGAPAPGAESQLGLWCSCVAVLGVEGRCPYYSPIPPLYLGRGVLRAAAELAAPTREEKEEKPAKKRGGAERVGMEKEAGRGGGARGERSAARVRARKGAAAPAAAPLSFSFRWRKTFRGWQIVFPTAASPDLFPRPKPISIALRLRLRRLVLRFCALGSGGTEVPLALCSWLTKYVSEIGGPTIRG